MNTEELKRLTADLRAAEANTTHERHSMLDRTWGALAEFCVDRADELLAMAEENGRLREALGDIATDKREHTDDEVAIIYRMQDRAKAALEGAEP